MMSRDKSLRAFTGNQSPLIRVVRSPLIKNHPSLVGVVENDIVKYKTEIVFVVAAYGLLIAA